MPLSDVLEKIDCYTDFNVYTVSSSWSIAQACIFYVCINKNMGLKSDDNQYEGDGTKTLIHIQENLKIQ